MFYSISFYKLLSAAEIKAHFLFHKKSTLQFVNHKHKEKNF